MAGLRIENLHKSYGALDVLTGIDLTIPDGEFISFLGPSGCGKSTLLRVIAGLEDHKHGEITLGSRDITDVPSAKRDIAMVFQNYALYPHMDVYKNLSFGLSLNGMKRDEIERRVNHAAEILQIQNLLKRKPRQLSGGQRQRVAIGRAIVREPSLFLLDEPLSNLDANLRVSMRAELAALHERLGITMIYVTHDQVEAMTLSDRVVVLDKGRIAQFGKPLELFYAPANLFVAGFIGSPKMNFFAAQLESATDGILRAGLGADGPVLDIPIVAAPAFASGTPLTLGIRPDRLELCAAEDAHLQGAVTLVERLGTESHVHVKLSDGGSVVSVVRGTHPVANHDTVYLRIPPSHCHIFDPQGDAIARRLDDETRVLIGEKART